MYSHSCRRVENDNCPVTLKVMGKPLACVLQTLKWIKEEMRMESTSDWHRVERKTQQITGESLGIMGHARPGQQFDLRLAN